MKLAALVMVAAGLVAPSPSAAAGCQVTYSVTSQWPGGFGATVAVTNLGDPITGWALAFAFPSGQRITQIWNAVATDTGARNAAWNASIPTNGTASFGFNGSFTGVNTSPASFTLNGVVCDGGVTDPPPDPDPEPGDTVRVMPLGDSITGSPGCWRALLWQQLQQAGRTEVDFVGTLPAQGCGFTHDGDNEGHGGFLAVNIANQNLLPGWLAATDPDVVMMHLGTNDVWNNLSPQTILAAFTKLVGQMRAANPAMRILVAQIIPMNPANCADCGQRAVALNAAIPAWAASLSTAASPVTVVDQWTGFSTATDTYDGVHPNDSGNRKIAARWYPALVTGIPTA
ncbi:cellulose binding domain-containing protein [Actinoplanes sp. NPDC051633]|uniref:cellulose binding domain-containing protein n=1 Tax=Actinoplanes sp. NPDC051633 TaxID=3155670 RepID=UPI003439B6F5